MTKIATVALAGTFDVELSAKHHLELIDEAADAGAQLVVFPEISLQGYPPDIDRFYPGRIADAFANAERVPDGPHVVAIAEQARARKIHVIFGLNELGDEGGIIYNTMVLTGPDGHIGSYRKVHVGITEQLTWRRGNDWPVFDTPFGKIGMLICYDKMWPESCRELTLRGADILVMSTAWGMLVGEQDPDTNVFADLYRLFDRARAAENHRWFVSSNFVGELGGTNYIGLSQIVDPLGRVVATSGTTAPGLVLADIDVKGAMADANATFLGARLIRDRRDDTYLAARGAMPIAIDG